MQLRVEDYLKQNAPQEKDEFDLSSRASTESLHKEPPKDYEKIIQKLEADVRNHIKI